MMTELQKLEVRGADIRRRVSALAGEALTDESRSEIESLRAELGDVELKRAALIETTHVPDTSESRTELRAEANVGEIFAAVAEGRETDGATRELQQELGLRSNQVPLELLEQRAVTPAPTSVNVPAAAVLMPVFAMGDIGFLGINQPRVPVGVHAFPVLTTRPTVARPAENASVAETTGAFTAQTSTPGRIQASFFYAREAAARFAGMDPALRQALSMGLSEGLDARVVGAIQASGDISDVNMGSARTAWADIVNAFHGMVDGRYASSTAAIRFLMGVATYARFASLYRTSSNNTDRDLLQHLADLGITWKVSPHISAVASKKQDLIARRGNHGGYVVPIWEGVTLIHDEVTRAATGQIQITAVMLANWNMLRTDEWTRFTPQITA